LTNNSIFTNTFGHILAQKSFSNSYSGVFTNDHGTISAHSSFINDYGAKFTNDYGLVTSAGDFYNRSQINGSGGGFKIAGYSENTWGASITGYLDITDTSLPANKQYVDTNYGIIDSKTVTKNSYKEPVSSLPVTFILWQGSTQGNQVLLEWQTASEQNSASFTVERSHNARDFTPIATIKAAGNSQQLRSYSYSDKTASSGTVYYRLKQTDDDGTLEYTAIISVKSKGLAGVGLKAYPNPLTSNEELHLSLNASKEQNLLLQIMDAQGRVVYQQSVIGTQANQTFSIPASVTTKLKGLGVIRCTDVNQNLVQTTKVLVL